MKNDRGVTLTIVIITVLLLVILAGLIINYSRKTYQGSQVIKFQTYMKVLQKKVDIALESGEDYETLGSPLTSEQKAKLQEIISADSNIATRDVDEVKLRYFSGADIENYIDITDVGDDIVINFANRDIISLNGVVKNNTTHYVDYTIH